MTRAIEGRVIAYRPAFASIAGTAAGGLLLSQMIYWQRRCRGWFFKEQAEFLAETGISRREYLAARARLRACGVLEERHGFRKLTHFRVDMDALAARLEALGERLAEPAAADPEIVSHRKISSPETGFLDTPEMPKRAFSEMPKRAFSYKETTNQRLQNSEDRGLVCPVSPDERAPAQNYFRVDRSWADAPADTPQVALTETALIAQFDALYDRWPRREKRGRARRAFLKAVREGLDKPTLLQGFERALSAFELEERQFVPMFSAWLADERWCDEHDDDEPADARVVVSPPAAAGYHRPGAARRGEDPDVLRWRARGKELLRAEPAGVASRDPSPPRPEPAERTDHQPRGADDVRSSKLVPFADIEPGDGRPEAARPAFEATPPQPPASEPSPPPAPEAALAPGERVLSFAEHMAMIAGGQCGPAVARGERRAGWPEHLRDTPPPPEPEPTGERVMNWAQHCALLDQQRAERAARRAERYAARGRPAPEARPFA